MCQALWETNQLIITKKILGANNALQKILKKHETLELYLLGLLFNYNRKYPNQYFFFFYIIGEQWISFMLRLCANIPFIRHPGK